MTRYTKDNPLRVIEVCAGYGSQSIALERLRKKYPDFHYKVVGISEIDKYALNAYYAIHDKDIPNLGDLTTIDWESAPKCDLFTYSTPCQSISSAGKQEGFVEDSGTASSILWSCREAIRVLRPKYLLQENVSAIVSNKFLPEFRKWEQTLTEMGYTNFATLMNSKDFGVPQNRLRMFMVSILDCDQRFEFPKTFPLEKRLKDVLEDEVKESYYLNQEKVDIFVSKMQEKGNRNVISIANEKNFGLFTELER